MIGCGSEYVRTESLKDTALGHPWVNVVDSAFINYKSAQLVLECEIVSIVLRSGGFSWYLNVRTT